jgi:cell division GTPase FtsZ
MEDELIVQPVVEAPAVGFDIEMDDIPLPEEAADLTIHDDFEGACDFAFVGAGQGGCRLAQTFYNMGYKRVCAINTAQQDMAAITSLPESNKLVFGDGGAGKDPSLAARVYDEHTEDVVDLMRRSYGPSFDRVFVCVGAGGGTGAGCSVPLVYTIKELQKSMRLPDAPVGMIVALPKNSEGAKVNANASGVLNDAVRLVDEGKVSPLIILDNQRIDDLYPRLAVAPFWGTANKSVASLFHVFNRTAAAPSTYTSLDQTDYRTLLDSGIIIFGATPVKNPTEATSISFAIRDNLRRNMLAGGIDLGTGSVAGVIAIGGPQLLAEGIAQEDLDHGFDQLSRILGEGSMVHRGIYSGNKETLVVYTMIGGLGKPVDRQVELAKLGGPALQVQKKQKGSYAYWNNG